MHQQVRTGIQVGAVRLEQDLGAPIGFIEQGTNTQVDFPGGLLRIILLAAALGNTLNVFLLDATHRSIGASTAVFAALGLVSGFVWRAKLMAQERWAWRLGPIVGGLALLAYTGTGDANTDMGAHLAGFACGFGSGILMTAWSGIVNKPGLQITGGILAIALVSDAWLIALLSWN